MKTWMLIICGIWLAGAARAQGKGGGIYLEDNSSCIGSMIYNNQAEDGFGIGGGDVTVLNATVVGNERIKQDTTRTAPGYIYCANGDIVDTTAYKERADKDAIGIVFWVRGDWTALDHKGAVVALEETKCRWGNEELNTTAIYQQEEWAGYAYMKDTACYKHTRDMENIYQSWSEFEAGHYCYHFEAEMQQKAGLTSPRWCVPTYLYLRRMFGILPVVENTLAFLKRIHSQSGKNIRIQSFIEGKDRNTCWYWSADDGYDGMVEYAYIVNFMTGSTGVFVSEAQTYKGSENYTRPIFIY